MKPCPQCQFLLPVDATTCQFCKSAIVPTASPQAAVPAQFTAESGPAPAGYVAPSAYAPSAFGPPAFGSAPGAPAADATPTSVVWDRTTHRPDAPAQPAPAQPAAPTIPPGPRTAASMPAEWGAPVAFTGATPSAPAAPWAPVPTGRKTPASKAKVITIVMGCAVIIGLGLSVLINRANGTGPFGAADTWASYTPADRSFTLEAPGTVEITDIPLTTADGTPFTETDYAWRTPDGGAVLLGTSVLPPLAGLDPVEGTIASLESRGLVIERRGAGSVGSVQTSEWFGHTNVDGREVATRGTAFLNGDRLFFVVASADGGADDFGDYERIEQSFRLPG